MFLYSHQGHDGSHHTPTSWSKTNLLIKEWLEQRQALLVLYTQVCTSLSSKDLKTESLQSFCQLLMDYLSAGHFNIFEKMGEAYKIGGESTQQMAGKLFKQILQTTHNAVDFNDKYTEISNLEGLSADLSRLGENIAHRMGWENNLVKIYLESTLQRPAPAKAAIKRKP